MYYLYTNWKLPERGTERDAEETEKVLMRTSQQGNKEDVI